MRLFDLSVGRCAAAVRIVTSVTSANASKRAVTCCAQITQMAMPSSGSIVLVSHTSIWDVAPYSKLNCSSTGGEKTTVAVDDILDDECCILGHALLMMICQFET